jgi:hypothetical protein
MPLILLLCAADILLSPLINNVNMLLTTLLQAASAIVQRRWQHNVAFRDNKDLEEELTQCSRPRLGEVDSSV